MLRAIDRAIRVGALVILWALALRPAAAPLGPADPSPSDPYLRWATFLGGVNADQAIGVAADAYGNIYVVGSTCSEDFPTSGAYDAVSNGQDGFVAKFSSDGALRWSTFLGGTSGAYDICHDVVIDGDGNVIVVGQTDATDFPVMGPFAAGQHGGGQCDAYVTKFSADGALIWSTCLGGTQFDIGNGVTADGAGNIYVTGYTDSSDFPTPGGKERGLHSRRAGADSTR